MRLAEASDVTPVATAIRDGSIMLDVLGEQFGVQLPCRFSRIEYRN